MTASLPLQLQHATTLALWSSPNKTRQGGEKRRGRIRWAGHFSDKMELIKTMNTSLSAKLVFPLVENSGQDKVFLNEPADQLFYFLCYFSCCVIDFIWALQIFFLYTEFLSQFFSSGSLMMLPKVELQHQFHSSFCRTSAGQGDLHLTQKVTFISLTTCYKNNKI